MTQKHKKNACVVKKETRRSTNMKRALNKAPRQAVWMKKINTAWRKMTAYKTNKGATALAGAARPDNMTAKYKGSIA